MSFAQPDCKWKIRFAAAANFTFRFDLDERRVLLGLVPEFTANSVPSSNRFWHTYEVGIGKQGSYFAVSGEYALFMECDDRLSHLFTYLCFTLFSSLPAVLLSPLSKQFAFLRKMINELMCIIAKPSCNLIGSEWLFLSVKVSLYEFETTFSIYSTACESVRSALPQLCFIPNNLKEGISSFHDL